MTELNDSPYCNTKNPPYHEKLYFINRWVLPLLAVSVMAGSSCSDDSTEGGGALPSVAIKFDAQLYPLTCTDVNEKFRAAWK